jgi:CHAD domain-containing protein
MADGKWITGLKPSMPVLEAAQLVLPVRFKVVAHYLPLAATSAANDSEHVHQLRVASRRAGAALELLTPCLPKKFAKRLRRLLKSLRRAAGAARDWDVFHELLIGSKLFGSETAAPARDLLLGICCARRMAAQRHLIDVAASDGEAFLHEIRHLAIESLTWEEKEKVTGKVGELAQHVVAALQQELSEQAAAPPAAYEELHAVRILGKRLRYSMEIFAECFSSPFREQLYPAVEEMQEILGSVTDAHVAAGHLVEIRDHIKSFRRAAWPRYQKPIEQLLRSRKSLFPRGRKQFLDWLPEWTKLTSELKPASLLLGE